MPILNKLEYLNATKQQIKNALNTNFNSQIEDNDTFRSYVDKIKNIYSNWPKAIGEDTTLSLTPTKKGLMKVELEGNASQDGTPTLDTPIPIKVVTGEQNINIQNKNLYDESKITDVSTYRSTATINNDKSITITSTGSNGYAIIRPFFNFKANETYTVSFNVDNVNNFNHMYLFINTSTTGGGYSKKPYVTITKTTDSLLGIGIYPNANATVTISNIQIEKGNTTTPYVPYQSQTYPLSLGNIELAIINNYKDYIFKNEVGSPYYNANLDLNGWYYSNLFTKINSYNGETITTPYISTTGGLDIGATVYYYNNSNVPIKITDTTLIQQLENINNNARSYKDTTYIICSSESEDNLPFIINASALIGNNTVSLNSLNITNLNPKFELNSLDEEITTDIIESGDVNE